MQLQGQVAVVTGAGRGLGRAIAIGCARAGAAVVLAARTEDEIAETAWLIEELGGSALAVTTDVRRASEVAQLAQRALGQFGAVDLLVNCAGVGLRLPFQQTDEARWDEVVDTLLKGTYLVSYAFVPAMVAQRRGAIVNITAPLERIVLPGFAAYTAAKYGVEGLTRVLARELRPHKISVNALHPGGFADTRLIRTTVPELQTGLLDPEMIVAPLLALVTQKLPGGTGQVIDALEWTSKNATP